MRKICGILNMVLGVGFIIVASGSLAGRTEFVIFAWGVIFLGILLVTSGYLLCKGETTEYANTLE